MKRILILLSVFGLLLGACGGGDDDKSNASDDDTSATTVKGDSGDNSGDDSSSDGELKAKLLAASDLPAGFKLTDSSEKDPSSGDDDDEDQDFCPELSNLDKDFPGDREAEASFERSAGASGGASINEQIKRFKDADEADDAFSAFESGFGKCKTFSETDDAEGTTLSGSFEKTDFAKTGDDTYGTILTMKQSGGGQSIELKGNFVALRQGKYIILLMGIGFGDEVTKAELESVAKKAVAKV